MIFGPSTTTTRRLLFHHWRHALPDSQASTTLTGHSAKRRLLQTLTATTTRSASSATTKTASDDNNLTITSSSPPPPFDKVLIANRGEIVQRVIRTCNDLGIDSVAVYSTADAQAPFVHEATEAICLGPAAASQSYLNVPAILRAINDTGAQAVHPGYGFLSENAQFARDIQSSSSSTTSNQAVWLGPPPSALEQMGDKLASKRIAEDAKVTTVPGYEQPLDSLEQALQLCHDGTVPYPVLLKAAAGGGGKGMRVCFNDQDLKEAWTVSKAESLQFFGDDRLLLEKFIEEPHHIEFQVLATPLPDGSTDVVVFPERECSIQRRNQKIIEESPSVLLQHETRLAMAEQVVRLCQAVGYESAGTIEFLVDKDQNFYFLEMNTRLQVEHPVTEAVCGGLDQLDLVKAMLWIGAGRGFPEEIQDLRATSGHSHLVSPTNHAMEARIYAEDPLRGFLPSTGPLLPYVEPKTNSSGALRVDSGVLPGHVVTPHYDPMLSKVIAMGKDRGDAIQLLSQAMDEYVIEGVQHNARLIQAVLRQNAFVQGDTPTSFLPTHFPDGFQGVELTLREKEEYAVAAVVIDDARKASNVAQHEQQGVVVRLGGFFGEAFSVSLSDDGSVASMYRLGEDESVVDPQVGGNDMVVEEVRLDLARHVANVTIGGVTRTVQVLGEDRTGQIKMQMYGADTTVVVQSLREYELSKKYMKKPEPIDTSSVVLSPMPGTLISFAVEKGSEVMEGQELCIVEAMKMQNIVRSPKQGTIAAIKVAAGDSLMADQVIMEFEQQ